MSGPRRTKGETLPVEVGELDRLKKETTDVKVPVVRPTQTAPNANVVAGRRGNSAHSLIKPPPAPPPPPPGEEEAESEEVVIEMSDDDDEPAPQPRRARSDTLADPLTTQKLAESVRGAPAPAPAGAPNRNVKRRGG